MLADKYTHINVHCLATQQELRQVKIMNARGVSPQGHAMKDELRPQHDAPPLPPGSDPKHGEQQPQPMMYAPPQPGRMQSS